MSQQHAGHDGTPASSASPSVPQGTAPAPALASGAASPAPAPPRADTPAPAPAPPPVHPPSDGVAGSASTGNMNQVLQTNFLGVHKLKVKQIQNTEYTRQLSKVGVKRVTESIQARGWISANAPYVLVPREQLPEGRETVWSSEVLASLQVFCLDGNHRLRALFDLYGPDFEVDARLYMHFDCAIMVNALARSKF